MDGEHQLVVATEVTANASDQGGLPLLLDEVAETVGEQPDTVLADAGYSKDSDRYKVAKCIHAEPVFCAFGRSAHSKVISVSVLTRIMREGAVEGETQEPPCGTNVMYTTF